MAVTTTSCKTITLQDLFSGAPEKRFKASENRSHYLVMRDGTRIAIDVMLPADAPPGTRFPTLMIMARYWRSIDFRVPDQPGKPLIGPRERTPDDFIPRGFALVVVDARGTGASFGKSRAPFAPEEIADYDEVLRWVVTQPWCSGRIGAYGISYEGATALRLASLENPAIQGVVPQEIEYDVYLDVAMPGGIFNKAFIDAWSMSNAMLDSGKPSRLFPFSARLFSKSVRPVDEDRKTRALLRNALKEHTANTDVFGAMSGITFRDDPFGASGLTLNDISVFAHSEAIARSGVPLFSWGSWLDGAAAEAALRTFNTFPNPQIAVIGAWKHEMTAHGSPYQKPGALPDPLQSQQWAAMTAFFQRTLVEDQPPVGKTLYYTTLGEEAWKQSDTFPPPGTKNQIWYLGANHSLSTTAPVDRDASDTYTVDFEVTTGRKNRWNTQMAQPVHYADRAKIDRQLLTYTSMPLEHDVEITGYPIVTLHVASTTEDAAFYVYLEDVDTRGVVRYITEGQLRAIHRKLADTSPPYVTGMPYHTFNRADAMPLPPGRQVEIVIGLQPTSVLIRRGHHIRVAIAGADKDTFARIPETGTPTFEVSRSAIAASHITLPIVMR